MTLSPPFRLLSRALAAASLIVTGLVLPGTVPTAAAATCGTANIAQGKTATASSTENAQLPGRQRGRRQHRHPLVQRLLRPAVARGRPRLLPGHLPGHPELGGRLRQGLPDPDLHRQLHLDHHLLHHHRHRRHPDPHRHRHRPLHPHVRHRPRHPVRLLALGIPGLRPGNRRRRHRLHRPVQHAELRPERLHLRPEHVQRDHPDHARHRLQHAEAQPVRHPAVRAAVQAGHLQRRRQHRLLHLDPGPRPEPGRRHHQRRRDRRRVRRHRQRHAELLAVGGEPGHQPRPPAPTAGPWPRPAPFRRMDVHGGLELYPASYGCASGGYIADTKVSGQVVQRVAAAVVHPRTATSAAGAARCGTWCSPA